MAVWSAGGRPSLCQYALAKTSHHGGSLLLSPRRTGDAGTTADRSFSLNDHSSARRTAQDCSVAFDGPQRHVDERRTDANQPLPGATVPIEFLDDDTAIVKGEVNIEEVNEALAIDIPEGEEFETIAGFIFNRVGRLVRAGEVVEYDGIEIRVEQVENTRIMKARITRTDAYDSDETDGDTEVEVSDDVSTDQPAS